MPSTYTASGVELIGAGEQSGTWNTTTNINLQILDRMVSQAGAIALSGTTHTLTVSDGVLSDGQYGVLVFGGSPSGANTVTISPNDARRTYIVKNGTAQTVIMSQGTGGTVSVPTGRTAIVYCDGAGTGASVVDITSGLAITVADLGITASTAELNTLDGITSTTAELNFTDGVTSNIQTQLNAKQPLDADLTAIGALAKTNGNFIVGNGTTWVAESGNTAIASLGITATAAELNTLDGITATTAELNYTDGVTSNIQTQLNGKQPLDADLTAIGALAKTDGNFIVGNGSTWVAESGNTAIASLGITSTAAELNTLDGFTGTVADLNYAKDLRATGVTAAEFDILDGLTATAAELNKLDGATVTTAEINYLDGVTSNVQTQLNTKAAAAITISAGDGLSGGGSLAANRTISHADTSSQASVNNSGTTFVQDITLDGYGHVTGIGSATIPQGIGDGQTWQVPSRSNGVVYQNTTGKPIMCASYGNRLHAIYISATGSGYVGPGLGWNNNGENPFFVIVPNGHYYYYATIYSGLAELR